jgi:hypothetical protein
VQEPNPAAQLGLVWRLVGFVQPSACNKLAERGNIRREKNWIVEQDLVALVTVHLRLPLAIPGTDVEDPLASIAGAIPGTAKESLRYVVMLRRMRAPVD